MIAIRQWKGKREREPLRMKKPKAEHVIHVRFFFLILLAHPSLPQLTNMNSWTIPTKWHFSMI